MAEHPAPDADPFHPGAVAPETRRFNEELEKQLAALPSVLDVPPEVLRDARAQGLGLFGPLKRLPQAEVRSVPGPAGPVPIRVIRPPRPRGGFLHLHGGGWTLGAEDQQDELLEAVARATGLGRGADARYCTRSAARTAAERPNSAWVSAALTPSRS